MSRAIDLVLQPAAHHADRLVVQTFTYAPSQVEYTEMSETAKLYITTHCVTALVHLTPDEARVLANQLLQVADTCDEHRHARKEDAERQASFDEVCEDMRRAEELGAGGTGCYYAHPDVHYVPAEQMSAKVRELNAAGVKRFMVLAEPSFEAAL